MSQKPTDPRKLTGMDQSLKQFPKGFKFRLGVGVEIDRLQESAFRNLKVNAD